MSTGTVESGDAGECHRSHGDLSRGRYPPRADLCGHAGLWRIDAPQSAPHQRPQAAQGSVVSSTSRLQTQLVRFQRVIDNLIASQAAHAGVSAQVFSDCAYIDVGRFSRRAVEVAPGLMRDFILADVPVRMGIGMGTYYAFRHSLEQADDQLVARSLVPASFSRTTRKRAARRDVGFSFTGRPKRACTTTNTTHP